MKIEIKKKENEIKILSWFQPPPTYEAVHAFSTTDADAMSYSPAYTILMIFLISCKYKK